MAGRLNEGDGIVLQFPAATKSNSLKMSKREVDEKDKSLVQLHSTSTVKMFPSSVSLDQETGPTDAEWHEAQTLQRQATRSLSAVKRKQPCGSGDTLIGGDVPDVDDVLHAMKVENKCLHTQSRPELADGGVAKEMESREVEDRHCLRKSVSLEPNRVEAQTTVSSFGSPLPKIKGPLLPSLPFKPVLVNRYKPVVSPKHSVPPKRRETAPQVSSVAEVSTGREEGRQPSDELSDGAARGSLLSDQSAVAMERTRQTCGESRIQKVSGMPFVSQASNQVHGKEVENAHVTTSQAPGQPVGRVDEMGEGEVVRQSLTEHTVKIITDKVRQMDARYV